MNDFQQAMLLRIRCEVEQLVTEREGMIAANHAAWAQWKAAPKPPYAQADFDHLAQRIAATAPDPHNFS